METKQEQYFEVGMNVWNIFGEGGTVVVIDDDCDIAYPLSVEFSEIKNYTYDGRGSKIGKVILFQTAPIITPNVPIIKFEEGELVWVRNGIPWNARFYSHSQFGKYACFENQQKEGSAVMWQDIRKFADNPLLTP